MEYDFVAKVLPEIGQIEFDDGPEILRAENVQRSNAMIKTHRAEQTEKAEAVIPVDVGDENCFDLYE
jgi:hypothetical protein